jgi:hypothetical protein
LHDLVLGQLPRESAPLVHVHGRAQFSGYTFRVLCPLLA